MCKIIGYTRLQQHLCPSDINKSAVCGINVTNGESGCFSQSFNEIDQYFGKILTFEYSTIF